MPLYEYECEACGNRFEKIQKFSDPLADTCPKCGGGPVHKLVSSPAIQFKGSGWYITDYAKKTDTKDTKAESTATKDTKSETTDTKTAATDTTSDTPTKKTETAAPAAAASKGKT